ncbi:hypothetical protein B0H17DRAFT_865873, partial [Mycena rosella]
DREKLKREAKAVTRQREVEKRKEQAQVRRKKEEEDTAAELAAKKAADHARAQEYFSNITESEEDGGGGFTSIHEFFDSLLAKDCPGNSQISANLMRFLKQHGAELLDQIVNRVPEIGEEFLDKRFDARLEELLRAEGKAIQELLSRNWTMSVTELLKEFSMEELGEQLQKVAPTLWRILEMVSVP